MYLNMAGPVRYNSFGQSGSATVHLDINYTRCWLHTLNDYGYDIIIIIIIFIFVLKNGTDEVYEVHK